MKPVVLVRPHPAALLRVAARAVGCTAAALRKPDRTAHAAFARAVAMAILSARGRLTHPEIGRLLHRHRSTVTHDLQALRDLCETDLSAARQVSRAAFRSAAALPSSSAP